MTQLCRGLFWVWGRIYECGDMKCAAECGCQLLRLCVKWIDGAVVGRRIPLWSFQAASSSSSCHFNFQSNIFQPIPMFPPPRWKEASHSEDQPLDSAKLTINHMVQSIWKQGFLSKFYLPVPQWGAPHILWLLIKSLHCVRIFLIYC